MVQHKFQRVAVFVDVQNMYYSSKNVYKRKVNFGLVLKKAIASRQLIRAFAYVIRADIKEENNFFGALEGQGYEIQAKDLQVFFGGAKKGDWDVGIAMDIIRMATKVDTIVLVSGDGDFSDLLKYVRALGCRAEVMAIQETTSKRLLDECDYFTPIDKKFLI